MSEVFGRFFECGIIPVIKIQDSKDALPLCRALLAGGLDVAEITLRTPAGIDSIARISAQLPEVLVGAGTVLDVDSAKRAVAAGAKYIVTPGLNLKVMEYCRENSIPLIPGAVTPSEIETAMSFGYFNIKFFPAETSGGLDAVKALAGPYSQIRFMPTGGLNPDNIGPYLRYGKIISCGATWMAKDELIESGNFAKITELAQKAVELLHGFSLSRLHLPDGESLRKLSGIMPASLGIFGGASISLEPDMNSVGTLGICTNSISRAVAFLRKRGFSFLPDDEKENIIPGTNTDRAVIREKIGDFTVYLYQD